MFEEYGNFDAVGLADLVSRAEVSASEVLESAIALAEKHNPVINAIVTTMYDEARDRVNSDLSGPLAGVPFLIKDLCMVEGVRCSMGSRLWQDFIPDHDTEIVRRYRKAGLVLFGKSNTPELGLAATTESQFLGACRNPWDLSRTPGGSSGGAAAAVAMGILPAAHATDGGGSIRIPASCCGLVGLKPTRGRTPLGPDVGEGWGGMSTGHVVSRTVRDSAMFLDVSHGPAKGDPYHAPAFAGSYFDEHQQEPGKLRIGIDLNPASGVEYMHDECRLGISNAAKLLEGLGHQVEEMDLIFDRAQFSKATYRIVASNVANSLQSRADSLGINALTPDLIEARTMDALKAGKAFSGEDYANAMAVIHRTGRTVESQFDDYDLIVSPTLLQPAVALGYMNTNDDDAERYGDHFRQFWGFTNLYNATGNPSISLPLHQSEDNLPVGIQFTAAFGRELLLLQLARQLETAQPWVDRKPAITSS